MENNPIQSVNRCSSRVERVNDEEAEVLLQGPATLLLKNL